VPVRSLEPLDNLSVDPVVAVAVQRVNPSQNHCGLLFREAGGDARLAHLAWHCDFRHEAATTTYTYARVDLHPLRSPAVAGWCAKVARANTNNIIPYGFSYPTACFDRKTGAWLLGQDGLGLTCATFVLAVLSSAGVNLVDVDRWDSRTEDEDWRQKIIDALGHRHAERASYLNAHREALRYRPEEVAGAALHALADYPVEMAKAVDAGERVNEQLSAG